MRFVGFAGRRAAITLNERPHAARSSEIDRSPGKRFSRAPSAAGQRSVLIAHAEPRAAYDATPRFVEPFCSTPLEDLPEEGASNRGGDFLELRL